MLLQVKGNQASVLGQVNRPGRYPIEVADMRLTDLLANAGGVASSGTEQLVLTGTRNGKPYRVEVELAPSSAPTAATSTSPSRTATSSGSTAPRLVYIYGEVQRPGPMRLERGMTLM